MRTDRPPAASVESACDISHIVAAFGIAYTFALVWLFRLVRTPVEACPPRRHCIRACLSCCVRAVAARDGRCKHCRSLPLCAQVLQRACDILRAQADANNRCMCASSCLFRFAGILTMPSAFCKQCSPRVHPLLFAAHAADHCVQCTLCTPVLALLLELDDDIERKRFYRSLQNTEFEASPN